MGSRVSRVAIYRGTSWIFAMRSRDTCLTVAFVYNHRVSLDKTYGSRMSAAGRNDSGVDGLKTCQPRRGALRNAAPVNRTSGSTRNPLSQFPFIRINLRNNRYLSFSSDMRDP